VTAAAQRAEESDAQLALPLVSVILATRGRPELVRESIRAVVDQTYPGPIECIVVHDQEHVDPTLKALGTQRHSVTVMSNTHAPGLAGARNTAVEKATGAFIATCDDDDLWHPTKLEKQIHMLLTHPDLLVVGSGIRLMFPAGRVAIWPARADQVTRQMLLRNRVKEMHSSTLVVHRDAFAKVGQYDELLPFGYAEDYDWILRASRVGRLGAVREPLADIRKDVPSWYRGRADMTATALPYFLDKHPEIAGSRRGHARILGQIAFAKSVRGERSTATRYAGRALLRWPLSPHAYLALAHVATGVSPSRVQTVARRFGRGLA
jgi:glycosyltransferase involved in cell wall biosynthesis